MTPDRGRDDHELMEAVARRDSTALAALYDRHGAVVLAICLRILGDRTDAEEVLGDVFWEAWERSERYEPGRGSPVAYLVTLAKSRALDRLRAVGRHQRRITELDPQRAAVTADVSGHGPFEEAALTEQGRRVRLALGKLEPAQRRAVEMSFLEGLSHSEIAEQLGEPLGTVKTRIRQGLIRLRESLVSQYGQGVSSA